jgi:hypothetical protein
MVKRVKAMTPKAGVTKNRSRRYGCGGKVSKGTSYKCGGKLKSK